MSSVLGYLHIKNIYLVPNEQVNHPTYRRSRTVKSLIKHLFGHKSLNIALTRIIQEQYITQHEMPRNIGIHVLNFFVKINDKILAN